VAPLETITAPPSLVLPGREVGAPIVKVPAWRREPVPVDPVPVTLSLLEPAAKTSGLDPLTRRRHVISE